MLEVEKKLEQFKEQITKLNKEETGFLLNWIEFKRNEISNLREYHNKNNDSRFGFIAGFLDGLIAILSPMIYKHKLSFSPIDARMGMFQAQLSLILEEMDIKEVNLGISDFWHGHGVLLWIHPETTKEQIEELRQKMMAETKITRLHVPFEIKKTQPPESREKQE